MQLILLASILNIVDSLLYLIGATVFRNQQTSTNDFTNVTDIQAFVFNIVGMLAFLAESILDFLHHEFLRNLRNVPLNFLLIYLIFLGI
jgi:hypothetical protein